jgi:signal transduction histidine kinase
MQSTPIQRKLMRVILLTSGAVLLLTCSIYFAYEYYTFKQSTVRQLTTLGQIISTNSTAALAFQSRDEAYEILAALKAEPHIVAAALYDKNGKLFVHYPANLSIASFPDSVRTSGYIFERSYLLGFQSVVQNESELGTLYLKSDMGAMLERFKLYGAIAILVIMMSSLLAYLLSKWLQEGISKPIILLAETAKAISMRKDYSVRATKLDNDGEFGLLTDAFNQMLTEIQEQNNEIQHQNVEILSFNQKLEQNIIDRTKELEVANKELEAFSYSVSHDLRSPLRSIDGYSRILIEDYDKKLDDEGRRILQVIMKNAVRMGQLIDDLLAFSRIGKQNLTKVNLNMETIVTGVTEELKNNYGKDVQIDIKQLLSTRGDSSMLKQVMINLVSNALKYSMKKPKSIIEIGSYADNNNHVYYVKDNGAGFDMRYYDKLFGVFQRLHSGNEFEGTGVGLALVQRIIHKHGGKVWAEGKVDEGATFYFSLPV